MDAVEKIKRYCVLGSFEPVYVHSNSTINVRKYLPIIMEEIQVINADQFTDIMRILLKEVPLIRKDETLLVFAAYINSKTIDIKRKVDVRRAFALIVHNDDELFLFCKYASLISDIQGGPVFSKSMRKAIVSWYEIQAPEMLRMMWTKHRGLHGFTHRILMILCRIKDEAIGPKEIVAPFFKKCFQIIDEYWERFPELPRESTPTELAVAISKLRTTTSNHEAIKIIRKFKLDHTQVPGHLLRRPVIMESGLLKLTYLQVLKNWRKMVRFNHFENIKVLKYCRRRLESRDFFNEFNLHPIHLLINIRKIAAKDRRKLPPKRAEILKIDYLEKIYKDSFGWIINSGSLRMYIALNLQSNYKRKMLRNNKKLNYYEACICLSYGFFKREAKVDIFHWYENNAKLKQIVIDKDFSPELAFAVYDGVYNARNSQRLVTPVMNALVSDEVYDVFLCIVPTAGRGNPKQNSDYLCTWVDKYREAKNPRARFIILNLLKYKRSMTYSDTLSENILEICGLDENTIPLIYNFVTYKFN